MAYSFINPLIGQPVLSAIVSAASAGVLNGLQWPIGYIAQAKDSTYGAGEFMLLPGVASNSVGLIVTYNPTAKTTTVATNGSTYQDNPVAVSMTGNSSTSALSWYQISGAAVVKKIAAKVNPNVQLYISSTAGRVTATLASGLQIDAMKSINTTTVASTTSTVTVVMQRSSLQGSKT